jgi:hypothetical protein
MLELVFPNLTRGGYRVTSGASQRYNCIAWAAGDNQNWWWPVSDTRFFWPAGVAREDSLAPFEAAFATLGFMRCDDETFENGNEKIAIFANAIGTPTHAARQLESGRWTSKLGEMEDIEHDLRDLEGDIYGTAIILMKRPR